MKKILIYTGVFIGLLVILWIIGNATKTFARYRSPSSANEPTIKKGTGFFVSSLKKPKRFDFICFQTETPQLGKYIATYRLCGLEGDLIEIKNGDLFVNYQFVDSLLVLSHTYNIAKQDLDKLAVEKMVTDDMMIGTRDSISLDVSDTFLKINQIKARRIDVAADEKNEHIAKVFGRDWNQDHFGPVTVPVGHYFVLGDNRHAAMDSRYLGFIPVKNFVATVLWRK